MFILRRQLRYALRGGFHPLLDFALNPRHVVYVVERFLLRFISCNFYAARLKILHHAPKVRHEPPISRVTVL